MKRQLAAIALLTAASQIAAFFKLWFTARIFGVGSELDGYNLALVLPGLISGIMAGVLQTGLFPVRAGLQAAAKKPDVEAFERSVLLSVAVLGVFLAIGLALASPIVVPLLGGAASPSVHASLAFAFPWLILLLALNMIGDCAGYLLAMRHRFAIAAGAPVANGILGGLLLAAWPQGGLLNLVLGTILGLSLQVAICLWGLRITGLSLFGALPGWTLWRRLAKDMIGLGAWILPGVVVSNLAVALPPLWMSAFGEGANSAFGYAYRLHSSTVQLLVMAGSPVILAHLAELVARNQIDAVRSILKQAAVASVVLGTIGLIVVGTLGAPLLGWVFGGRFDSAAAERVANHWWWLTLGLAFLILGNVFAKLWQSQRRPRHMSVMAGASLIVLGVSFYALRQPLGEFSVAAAMSVAAASVVIFGIPQFGLGQKSNRYGDSECHEKQNEVRPR